MRDIAQLDQFDDLTSAITQSKYSEIYKLEDQLQQEIAQYEVKENELTQNQIANAALNDELGRVNAELQFIKSSKFWKVRNIYFKLRLNTFHPKHIYENLAGNRQDKASFNKNPLKSSPSITTVGSYRPLVSIVVPSYNHGQFLRQRLESIFTQTYDNYEVLLLDDNSSDDSQTILLEYAQKYPKKVSCSFNSTNSGNVFSQWKRGIESAKGSLIWIAESDDFCDNDFLEQLTGRFEDESVMLAYAYTEFVNLDGSVSDFSFDSYTADLSTTKWAQNYVETAHNEVRDAIGIKNTIPNVSGVLFRNIPSNLFDYSVLKNFKVCGDWYFYLSIIRGGRLAFVRDTKNYYRFHPNNTSSNYQKNVGFVKEHELIACHIARNFKVNSSLLNSHMQSVRKVWNAQNPGLERQFYSSYSMVRVKAEQKYRKPNILMGIYAFTTGGGETVPIRLANKLKEDDYAVTLFDCNMARVHEHTTRSILNQNIPVIQRDKLGIDNLLSDFGIDIIHTHHTTVDLLFAARRDNKISQIVTTHGLYETLPAKVLKKLGPTLKNVSSWVYVADKNLQPLKTYNWFQTKSVVKIRNGFTPSSVKAKRITRRSLRISDDSFVICLASRAMKEKGWLEAIDAVKLANKFSSRNITLLLIGDGPVYDILVKQPAEPNIRILGFQKDVFGYFELSDAGLLPTSYQGESCPMVLIECLVAQRPFVSTDIGEIRSMLTVRSGGSLAGEVISLKNGIVNIADLAKAVVKLSNDQDYYVSCRNNAIICGQSFSIDLTAQKYKQVYSTSSGLV